MTLVAAALLAAVGLSPAAAAQPKPGAVTSYGTDLMAVSADSATDAWAVGGDVGPYITLHWNGTSWTKVQPAKPLPGSELYGVAAISPSDAWAVGHVNGSASAASPWIIHWNGKTWTQVAAPTPSGSTDVILTGVSAVSASDVWAVGQFSVSNGSFDQVALHWNGTSWAIVPTPKLELGSLNGVTAVSADDVWAVGSYGGKVEFPLVLHWNGTSWTKVATPPLGTSIADLDGVSAGSANDVWAVGWDKDPAKNLVLHWNGTSWTSVAAPNPGLDNELEGVVALSAGDAWAVGGNDSSHSSKTFPEALHWNGHAWAEVSTPDPGPYTGLGGASGVSADDVLAVGGTGTAPSGNPTTTLLLHWNGTSWVRT